jgi:hypothetical protein
MRLLVSSRVFHCVYTVVQAVLAYAVCQVFKACAIPLEHELVRVSTQAIVICLSFFVSTQEVPGGKVTRFGIVLSFNFMTIGLNLPTI